LEPLPTDTVRIVTQILEGYATNGVLRGFNVIYQTHTTAKYRIVWHYDRTLHLTLNVPKRTLQLRTIFPEQPLRSPMYGDLKEFVERLHSSERPDHRRIDPACGRLACSNRRGDVAVTMTVVKNDFEYAVRKLIHAANEIFVAFLADGPYSEYVQKVFGFDPDRIGLGL
jgi:hypothetical protein